jgi:3-methylcrotonyl-CoA carboxylase beta subunit
MACLSAFGYGCSLHGLQWTEEEIDKFKGKITEAYEREGNCYYSAARFWVDGIVDPADTRKIIGLCISASLIRPSRIDTKYYVFNNRCLKM